MNQCKDCKYWTGKKFFGECNNRTVGNVVFNDVVCEGTFGCIEFEEKSKNHRIGNLELRDRKNHHNISLDIIKYYIDFDFKEYGKVIAFWRFQPENSSSQLEFIGNRPFDDNVNKDDFWKLAKLGQELVDVQ